jgi:hypothetical protein
MALSPLPAAYSQVTWPGVGDIDDCWVLVPFWSLVASRNTTQARLPSVTTFRAKAGVPDLPTSNGGNNLQALKAVLALYPNSKAYSYVGLAAGFWARVDKGEVASVSVKSSALPLNMRHGFLGNHQVAIAKQGTTYFLMNPLQKTGERPYMVTKAQAEKAAFALYGDGKFHAVMFPDHPPVDPTLALKAEIAALKASVAAKDATIAALTAKIAAVRNAIL